MTEEKHVMTMLVDNEPGVTSRVAGLFSGKGFNIESICGSPTNDPKVSRITIVTQANPPVVEQIEKQLRKLVNVIKLRSLNGPRCVRREMALACVQMRPSSAPRSCGSWISPAVASPTRARPTSSSRFPASRNRSRRS